MATDKKLVIGLFGFGTVGKGLYDVLQQSATLPAYIKKICIRNISKKRTVDAKHFTTSADELLNDKEINCIVELIDDAEAAFKIVKLALQSGKAVVSANKKMIADHFRELLDLQKKHNVPFLYEGACCASMPVIRNLEEYYNNDPLKSFRGIINGSTNYILSQMFRYNSTFSKALKHAQDAGFAESDPGLDMDGYDPLNKLKILLCHAYGVVPKNEELLFHGIRNISTDDISFAREKNYSIKLVAQALRLEDNKLATFILPQFIPATDQLFHVHDEYNALLTESSFADRHFFLGKGAGAFPTASAVLSDISALRYDYRYEYRKIAANHRINISHDYFLKVHLSYNVSSKIIFEDFESIEEINEANSKILLVGTISAKKLLQTTWWKNEGISIITYPDPVLLNFSESELSELESEKTFSESEFPELENEQNLFQKIY